MRLNQGEVIRALVALQPFLSTTMRLIEGDLKKILLSGATASENKERVLEPLSALSGYLNLCHKLLLNSGKSEISKGLKEKDVLLRTKYNNLIKEATELWTSSRWIGQTRN